MKKIQKILNLGLLVLGSYFLFACDDGGNIEEDLFSGSKVVINKVETFPLKITMNNESGLGIVFKINMENLNQMFEFRADNHGRSRIAFPDNKYLGSFEFGSSMALKGYLTETPKHFYTENDKYGEKTENYNRDLYATYSSIISVPKKVSYSIINKKGKEVQKTIELPIAPNTITMNAVVYEMTAGSSTKTLRTVSTDKPIVYDSNTNEIIATINVTAQKTGTFYPKYSDIRATVKQIVKPLGN